MRTRRRSTTPAATSSGRRRSSASSSAAAATSAAVAASAWVPESFQDGQLEVTAIAGALALGRIQLGLERGTRLAQSASLTITLRSKVPVQADGEPLGSFASQLVVAPAGFSVMLLGPHVVGCAGAQSVETGLATELVEWGKRSGVLSAAQVQSMTAELSLKLEARRRQAVV